MEIKIVIAVNKNDVWFCRICVASIRYYYPEVEIFLLKDELNGKFSTKEIERKFSIRKFNCEKTIFGWAASKTYFLLLAEKNQKYLILDSDIVFVDSFLERVLEKFDEADFIVSGEYYNDIYSKHVKDTYFDVVELLKYDPYYRYPGFYFNTGQLFITGGLIKKMDLFEFFDMDVYPYWKRLDLLPLVDQSLYNYIFPKLHYANNMRLKSEKFMTWSESEECKAIKLNDIIAKSAIGGLIHWAGATRTPFINNMTRHDILKFFQDEYYRKDPLKNIKIFNRKYYNRINSYFLRVKNKIKKHFNEKSFKKNTSPKF